MKRTRTLWLLLLALLLSGCVSASDQIENTPEYQAGYEQAQTDMEDYATEHPVSAWEAFPTEMEQAQAEGYREGYVHGYQDALNGVEPEYDVETEVGGE